MKKSVLIIILGISTLSIILVGLFFQKAEIYNPTVYVEQIIPTHVRVGDDMLKTFYKEEDNIYYVENPARPNYQLPVNYVEGLTVQVIYAVNPSNASNATVSFYASETSVVARVDRETGFVTFLDFGIATITLIANDNSNAQARIRIYAKPVL